MGIRTRIVTRVQPSKNIKSSILSFLAFKLKTMPQLDLVTFPSQVFWLAIIFMSFYAFVSGHFVPLLHKIIQTRAKKVLVGQSLSSGQSDAEASVVTVSENLVVSALDKSIINLNVCVEEAINAQSNVLRAGDKSKVKSLANTVGFIQGRYLVSRGLYF